MEISKPVNVVDFGFSYGYICDLIMPILSQGSTYTGIDNSKGLLKAAIEVIVNFPKTWNVFQEIKMPHINMYSFMIWNLQNSISLIM